MSKERMVQGSAYRGQLRPIDASVLGGTQQTSPGATVHRTRLAYRYRMNAGCLSGQRSGMHHDVSPIFGPGFQLSFHP
jgi:hypothetical protein